MAKKNGPIKKWKAKRKAKQNKPPVGSIYRSSLPLAVSPMPTPPMRTRIRKGVVLPKSIYTK